MAIQKTSSLMTIGGIIAAVGAALVATPIAAMQTYAIIIKDGPPHWMSVSFLIMIVLGTFIGPVGAAIMGIAGRGQDDVPTVPQVNAATEQAQAEVHVEAAKTDPAAGGK